MKDQVLLQSDTGLVCKQDYKYTEKEALGEHRALL